MAENVQKTMKLGVNKGGDALIGGGTLNGEFTVYRWVWSSSLYQSMAI